MKETKNHAHRVIFLSLRHLWQYVFCKLTAKVFWFFSSNKVHMQAWQRILLFNVRQKTAACSRQRDFQQVQSFLLFGRFSRMTLNGLRWRKLNKAVLQKSKHSHTEAAQWLKHKCWIRVPHHQTSLTAHVLQDRRLFWQRPLGQGAQLLL